MEEEELQQKVEEMEKELNGLRPLKDTSIKLQEEFKQKEGVWLKEKQELEGQINPNWQKARKSLESMKTALKDKGVEVDEDGNVISNPQHIDIEKIKQEAAMAAKSEIVNSKLEELLSDYDDESGKMVRYFYNKLTAGENITLQNIGKFVKQAHLSAEAEIGTTIKNKAFTFTGGQGPRGREEEETKLSDQAAKELGSRMGLPFAQGEEQ